MDITHNHEVSTPNGPGVMVGMMQEDNLQFMVIRHQVHQMTGQTAGRNLTPRALVSGLWQYDPSEIK